MRKARDGEDTKQRVLSAAQALFAEKGFNGTSLAEISRRCGISDGLILHHYHNKQNLYNAVLEMTAGEYADVLAQARAAADSPQAVMQQTLLAAFNYWKSDDTYQRLSQWAALEGQADFAQKEAELTAGLAEDVRRLQAQGLISSQASPAVLLSMVIGPIHFWLRHCALFKTALHLAESEDELDRQFLAQLMDLVTGLSHENQGA